MPSSLNMNYLLDPASDIVTASASAGHFEHLPIFSMLLLQLAHDAQVELPQSSTRRVPTPPPMTSAAGPAVTLELHFKHRGTNFRGILRPSAKWTPFLQKPGQPPYSSTHLLSQPRPTTPNTMSSSLNMNYLLQPTSDIVTVCDPAEMTTAMAHLPTFAMLLLQLAHDARVEIPESPLLSSTRRRMPTPPPMTRTCAVIPKGTVECPPMERL
ncbi:hypothetical protein C8F01DRAFT_1263238 [Mycena amicta]|nr:hypothetical protein C8F01DRAFT_1263238 [Mycena amicta]